MNNSYIVTVEEAEDGSGELVLPIPEEMMTQMGWQEGDDLSFEEQIGQKSFTITNHSWLARQQNK